MTITTKLNDVDLDTVGTLVETIQADPTRAATTWHATATWSGAFRSEVTIRDFDPVASDEPAALGGTDTAPNPVEQLLGALGNCLVVGYAVNAAAAGIELRDLRVDIEGDLDLTTFLGLGGNHAGYDDIRVTVAIDADADADALHRLHERVIATSPVAHTLQRPIPVEVALTST